MPQTIAELMNPEPVTCEPDADVRSAAELMRDQDIGDVVVVEGSDIRGIVTDRDIAIRAVAEGRGPDTRLADILSDPVVTASPTDSVEHVVDLMRRHAVRRIPVVESGRLAGVVSLGDLAIERDAGSALADISAAHENN
jgi:CBS domain-containing protein